MHKKVIEFNLSQRAKKLPDLKAGDIVRVYRKIKEGEKERTQVFEGIIIAIKGKQSSSPIITVRKISFGVGVELILPIYSPQVEKIELVKRAKVKRSKLYYIREKSAKSMRMKYEELSEFTKEEKTPKNKPEDTQAGGGQEELKEKDNFESEAKKESGKAKSQKKEETETKKKEDK